ncbi:hypothetical protein BDF14DRAFT_1862729 [Spinellus fusiger]|nr:hypothetical protein BDF14DRAFT_1862729 [Spinellus fusiger]
MNCLYRHRKRSFGNPEGLRPREERTCMLLRAEAELWDRRRPGSMAPLLEKGTPRYTNDAASGMGVEYKANSRECCSAEFNITGMASGVAMMATSSANNSELIMFPSTICDVYPPILHILVGGCENTVKQRAPAAQRAKGRLLIYTEYKCGDNTEPWRTPVNG